VDSLLNPDRPPVFCPGCSHDRSIHTLDRALKEMGLKGSDVVIVSDIGCSGLSIRHLFQDPCISRTSWSSSYLCSWDQVGATSSQGDSHHG